MTPIERVTVKSRAFSDLGLGIQADLGAIRAAYRQLAFDKHPDRGRGTSEDFAAIADAYHFLVGNAQELGIRDAAAKAPTPRRVSRPSVRPSETQFSEQIMSECRALLDGTEDNPQHVPTHLHRTGRKLTYFVPTTAAKGINRVALPTGELVDARRVVPQVVSVDSRDMCGGVFEIPAHICARHFPGARSVHIRFAG